MDEFARGFDPEQALRAVTALPGPGSGAGDERAIPPLDEGDHGAVHAKLVGRMSHAGDTGDTNGTAVGLVDLVTCPSNEYSFCRTANGTELERVRESADVTGFGSHGNLQRRAYAPSSHRSIDILRSTLSPSIELSRGSQPSYLRAKPSSIIGGTSAMPIIAARPWATNGLEADPSIAMLTRGSPKTLATFRFRWPGAIQIKFSSKMNHAGVVCGEPSDRRVVNHAISRSFKDRVAASDSRVITR